MFGGARLILRNGSTLRKRVRTRNEYSNLTKHLYRILALTPKEWVPCHRLDLCRCGTEEMLGLGRNVDDAKLDRP